MAVVRSCVCLLVVLVHLQGTVGKPFFDWLMCDMVCDDDDIMATTSASTGSDLFSFDCSDCPLSENARTTTARPVQSVNLRLPGSPNGISLNVTDNNGILQFVLDALSLGTQPQSQSTAAPAAALPAGNGTAGNGTAAS